MTSHGHRVVSVSGITLAHYEGGDRAAEAFAMVCLIDHGWAKQKEIAAAFGCSTRTVGRHQSRIETGGPSALGKPTGYPRGRPRSPASRTRQVNRWKAEGVSNREIARRLGVSEKTVRKQLRRLGWKPKTRRQLSLPLDDADPKGTDGPSAGKGTSLQTSRDRAPGGIPCGSRASEKADSNPSTPGPVSHASSLDAGVLLALPALVDSGVLAAGREIYGSLAPAFYGLRTTIVTLLLMALLCVKRPEALKEHSPRRLGSDFKLHEAMVEGYSIRYLLNDRGIYISYGPPAKRRRLRQVMRLSITAIYCKSCRCFL